MGNSCVNSRNMSPSSDSASWVEMWGLPEDERVSWKIENRIPGFMNFQFEDLGSLVGS